MSIKPLRTHYAFETPASIFDEEALTALELAGRQGAKINEIVEVVNDLDTHTRDTLKEQDEKVEQYTKEMAEALDKFTTETDDKIDTFLTDTAPGIVEAEVQRAIKDGEFDESLEKTIAGAMTERENPETLDADLCTENGMFYVRTADGEWQNVPDTQGGVLLCVYGGTDTRFYQIFIDYNESKMYVRSKRSDGFTDWYKVANDNLTISQKWFDTTGTVDFNALTESGYYMLSSNNAYTNAPPVVNAGLLIVYKDSLGTQVYQMVIAYGSNQMYVRGGYNGTFDEWKTVINKCTCDPSTGTGTGDSTDTGGSTDGESYPGNFYVEKVDDNSFYVYKPTGRGFIRYLIGYISVSSLVYQSTRILGIAACDKSKAVVHEIAGSGCDSEGAYIVSGHTDYVCGAHGGEYDFDNDSTDITTPFRALIDGTAYDSIDALPEGWHNSIVIHIQSLTFEDWYLPNHFFIRDKRLIFTGEKLYVLNTFTARADAVGNRVQFKMGMLNAPDGIFSEYLNSAYGDYGVTTSPTTQSNSVTCAVGNSIEFFGHCYEKVEFLFGSASLYPSVEYLNERAKGYFVTAMITIAEGSVVKFGVALTHDY